MACCWLSAISRLMAAVWQILGNDIQLLSDFLQDPAELGELLAQFAQSPDQYLPHVSGGRGQRHMDCFHTSSHAGNLVPQRSGLTRAQRQARLQLRRQRITQPGLPGIGPAA